jgi:hypothetical protein
VCQSSLLKGDSVTGAAVSWLTRALSSGVAAAGRGRPVATTSKASAARCRRATWVVKLGRATPVAPSKACFTGYSTEPIQIPYSWIGSGLTLRSRSWTSSAVSSICWPLSLNRIWPPLQVSCTTEAKRSARMCGARDRTSPGGTLAKGQVVSARRQGGREV